ncbi:MAG: serine protease [Deltaproteobacteria bacterium]
MRIKKRAKIITPARRGIDIATRRKIQRRTAASAITLVILYFLYLYFSPYFFNFPSHNYAQTTVLINQSQLKALHIGVHKIITGSGMGSGILFKYKGNLFCMTASHVDFNKTDRFGILYNGRIFRMKPVKRYESYDIVLLHLLSNKKVPCTNTFKIGAPPAENEIFTYYMGYGKDIVLVEKRGYVSNTKTRTPLTEEDELIITAEIDFSRGDSGGPVFAVDLREDDLKCIGIIIGMYASENRIGVVSLLPPTLERDMRFFLIFHPIRRML